SQFGRVFRANRSALVRVRCEKPGARWADGVVIGAKGEVLLGVSPCLTPTMRVMTADGLERAAQVLGFDRKLGVAVARLEAASAPRLVPPRVNLKAKLVPDQWMVVLTHDKKGQPTSHAGQVARRTKGPRVPVDVPGRVGSPLFSAQGALVGISVTRGRRRVQVRPVASL
ncbi:unnamed protein product, partial [Laminaria digitata]